MSITLIIVVLSCAISFWAFNDQRVFANLLHSPYLEDQNHQYYRWITSGFLHGDVMHLLINMYVLWQFGTYVENYYISQFGVPGGQVLYAMTYLTTLVMADIPTYYKHRDNPGFSSVGASGAVSGILFIYILLSPLSMLGLYFIIPVPAIIFGVLYLWYSSWAQNQNDRIDHAAHFYGAIAGMLLAIVFNFNLVPEFFAQIVGYFQR